MTVTAWTLTMDCDDAGAMARFWSLALGYVERSPPEGWDTWKDWLRHFAVPEEEWGDGAARVDPRRGAAGPDVPEGPGAEDDQEPAAPRPPVSGGRHQPTATRTERIEAMVARLIGAGATSHARLDQPDGSLDHVLMADPEGTEFCVV